MKKKQLNLTPATALEPSIPIHAISVMLWAWEVCTSGSPRDFLPWQEWEDR